MGLEIRKIETVHGETPDSSPDTTEVTYELGFTTTNGGWVKFVGVPEHVVVQADENAKAAQPDAPPPPDPLPPDAASTSTVEVPTPDHAPPVDPAQ